MHVFSFFFCNGDGTIEQYPNETSHLTVFPRFKSMKMRHFFGILQLFPTFRNMCIRRCNIAILAFQCMVCCQARSVMQVSPCGHQALCRLCFVHNIQEAVAARDLPLKCLLCGAKIIRVKNNSKAGQGTDHPVHVGIGSRVKRMPKSVSGYSLCATSENEGPDQAKRQPSMAQSQSSYSMSSGK